MEALEIEKDKEKKKEEKPTTLYWTKKEPRKSLATFQRNQNKIMVNMVNVLDRKAAILIRINTALISGIVVFFEHISEIENGSTIGLVLVSCCFVSLVLALLAAKPPLTRLKKKHQRELVAKYPAPETHSFMVGLSGHLTLDEYEDVYHKIVQSQELQLGNQIRMHYVFEKNIVIGFKILEYSYNAFLLGFVFTVVTFVLSNIV
ncbi:MAG: hypothetical protein AAF654_08090 [Myxococcota bacterium]